MIQKLKSNITWSVLSKVGNNKVFKTSFIWLFFIPIIAKSFHNIESISLTINENIYKIDLTLPFSLQMLFFSAFFATIGQILYSSFAPSLISNYLNYQEFENTGKGDIQLKIKYFKMIESDNIQNAFSQVLIFIELFTTTNRNDIIDDTLKSDIENSTITREEADPKFKRIIIYSDIDNEKKGQLFWYMRDKFENPKPNIRLFIFFFYGLAFLCLGIIAIENIFYVATQLN